MVFSPWLHRCVLMILAIAALGYLSPAQAQGVSGTIAGTVLDSSGASVPGATVTVTSSTNQARTAVTDAFGSYTVPSLAAGTYRVEVHIQGFTRFVRRDVQVQADATSRVDATLEISVLEEVVVTARRREELLQDTPVAISPFTAATLEARQIQQTQDLERIAPSVQFKPAGQLSGNSAASVVFIRGVGQVDPTAAVDPGVGMYIDEVYVGRAVGGLIEFGDIAGVEVLRGPQGTLFGRNTIGGAILVHTRTPEIGELSSKVRLRVGQDGLYDGFAAVNLPMGETAAARLSGGFRKRDGYVTRPFDGRDLGNEDIYSFNGGLTWKPSRESPDSLILRADYTKRDENGAPFTFAGINESAPVPAIVSVAAGCPGATMPFLPAGHPRLGPPNVPLVNDPRCANDFQTQGDFISGGTAPVVSTSEVWGLSGTGTVHLTDQVSLKSITAYRSTDSRGVRDADNTPFVILTTDLTTDSTQFSEEIQLQLDAGRIGAIVGGYYFTEQTDERASVPLSFPPAPPIIASILAGGPGSRDLQYSDLETDSLAAFGQVSFKPAVGLELAAGLRYTEDRKTYQGTVLNLFPASQPDPNPLPTLAVPDGGPLFIFNRPFKDTFSALTGSASVQYRWSPLLSTYASYARSFKSGGFNTRYNAAPADFLPVPFDEEKVNSYELGAKIDAGGAFRLNIAAFQADYQDIQLIFRQGVVPLLFNAGNATIRGFEAEVSYRPTASLTIDGGFSTLDDEVKSITPVPGATATVAPGDELPLTPSFQGNLAVSVPVALNNRFRVTPRIDTNYTSKLTFITGSVPIIEQDGYAVVNASVALAELKRGWQLTTGVQNLLDERYLIQGNASLATLGYAERIFARPRSWFLQLSVDF